MIIGNTYYVYIIHKYDFQAFAASAAKQQKIYIDDVPNHGMVTQDLVQMYLFHFSPKQPIFNF